MGSSMQRMRLFTRPHWAFAPARLDALERAAVPALLALLVAGASLVILQNPKPAIWDQARLLEARFEAPHHPAPPYAFSAQLLVIGLRAVAPGGAEHLHELLRVVALASDGSRRDVTTLARFHSNNASIAEIDEHGRVTAKGPGDTHVFARFSRFTMGAEVVVLPPAEGFEWPGPPAVNYIDELVFDRLRKLRIAPSEMLKSEDEARLQERRAMEKLEDLVVKLQPVNYASVKDVEKLVKRLLTPRGTVDVDQRTNTVILKDIPSVIDEATALIKATEVMIAREAPAEARRQKKTGG